MSQKLWYSKGRNKQSAKAQMNAEKKKQLWTKASSKQKSRSFRGTLLTCVNRFTQRFCGAEEGKADELRDSDNDPSLSKDEVGAKCSSAPVCLRKSVRARTGFLAACVSYDVAHYTPISAENFSFPIWASRKTMHIS
jgi:hypothetical protein